MTQQTIVLTAAAVTIVTFNVAFAFPRKKSIGLLMFLNPAALAFLAYNLSPAGGFATGAIIGVATVIPQLLFFRQILGVKSIGLWLMLIGYQSGFLGLAATIASWDHPLNILFVALLWLILEYLRCELSPLRFAWLSPMHPVPEGGNKITLGSYGFGWWLMILSCIIAYNHSHPASSLPLSYLLAYLGTMMALNLYNPVSRGQWRAKSCMVVGVPMEAGCKPDGTLDYLPITSIIAKLDQALNTVSHYDLVVVPEYALDSEPPPEIMAWCVENQVYLVIGGKRHGDSGFYNTAFVISSTGEIVFEQSKVAPIPVLPDGLPAKEQNVWDSPWGKIGICICYDAQFNRVTDPLIWAGAECLIILAMDLQKWGKHEHELHELIPPILAGRYGLDILRVVSSGRSQFCSEGFGSSWDSDSLICGNLSFRAARIPLDGLLTRLFGPLCRPADKSL